MKTVVLLSGGLDSTVLLAELLKKNVEVSTITFDYCQKHSIEIDRAIQIASHFKVPHRVAQIPPSLFKKSALTSGLEVPKDLHYSDPKQSATVVPGRNLLFLSMAICDAASLGYDAVAIASHQGDFAVYRDCRESFFNPLSDAVLNAYGISLVTPYLKLFKKQIVKIGLSIDAPLDLTWSCYDPKGGKEPCGRCGACIERQEAFE